MDPITIIGAVGSVVSIIDLVGKTITGIRELKNDWKDADLTFYTLIAQLTALNGALRKIDEWTKVDGVDDPHHQLVMDLDMSVNCCRFLVGKIESHLAALKRAPGETTLDFGSKFRMVFKGGSIDELQRQIEHQTTALNLLLTACNCKTVADQKVILEKTSTRKVITKVKEDSASLIVHRDSASIRTCLTDNLSKLSMVFSFDWELFGSKVYDRALRGSIKERLRRQQSSSASTTLADKQNLEIERSLKSDQVRLAKEVKLLILGGSDSGKDEIIRQLRLIYMPSTITPRERVNHRPEIFKHIIRSTQRLIGFCEENRIKMVLPENVENVDYCKTLLRMDHFLDAHNEELVTVNFKVAKAVKSIWSDPSVSDIGQDLESMDTGLGFDVKDFIAHYVKDLDRISQPGYVPNEQDIVRLPVRGGNGGRVTEYTFDMGSLAYRLYDVGSMRSERKKWMPMFENISNILFVVNLAAYDRPLPEDPDANTMQEALMLFESLANSQWFIRTAFIVLLNNVDEFKGKLSKSPLKRYFPDYCGGETDSTQAANFFAENFRRLHRNTHQEFYIHFTNPSDTNLMRVLTSSVHDTILQRAQRSLIL